MVEMARVLVAEDDEDILVLLETVLDDAGFAVVVATDVAAALRILRAGGIDCVLTDLGLPGQSGIVLAEAASAVGLPVVVATGSMAQEGRIETAGWRLLRKPFRLEDLVATLQAALANRRAPAESAVPEFLGAMAERCHALAGSTDVEALARELTSLADEMHSRARGAA
jgi:DNA-binding response OmpR family regulator